MSSGYVVIDVMVMFILGGDLLVDGIIDLNLFGVDV